MSTPNIALLASLLVIAIGYATRKLGLVGQRDGNVLAALVLNVTLPALILSTLPGVEIDRKLALIPLFPIAQNLVVFALAQAVFRREPRRRRGLLVMTSLGFNNGLFAFPIIGGIWGSEAVAILAIFDIGNAVMLLGVNYVLGSYYAAEGGSLDARGTLRVVGKSMIQSTPLVAFVVALLLNRTGLTLPALLAEPIGILAAANAGMVLLLLGIFQSFNVAAWEPRTLIRVFLVRYLPGLLCGVALFLFTDYSLLVRKVLLVAFILPVGMTIIPYSVKFGFDYRLATTMVNTTIVLSFAIIWAVVALLG